MLPFLKQGKEQRLPRDSQVQKHPFGFSLGNDTSVTVESVGLELLRSKEQAESQVSASRPRKP